MFYFKICMVLFLIHLAGLLWNCISDSMETEIMLKMFVQQKSIHKDIVSFSDDVLISDQAQSNRLDRWVGWCYSPPHPNHSDISQS